MTQGIYGVQHSLRLQAQARAGSQQAERTPRTQHAKTKKRRGTHGDGGWRKSRREADNQTKTTWRKRQSGAWGLLTRHKPHERLTSSQLLPNGRGVLGILYCVGGSLEMLQALHVPKPGPGIRVVFGKLCAAVPLCRCCVRESTNERRPSPPTAFAPSHQELNSTEATLKSRNRLASFARQTNQCLPSGIHGSSKGTGMPRPQRSRRVRPHRSRPSSPA